MYRNFYNRPQILADYQSIVTLIPVYLPSSSKGAQSKQTRPATPTTSFTLYPNPAKDYVELHWNWLNEGLNGTLKVSVFSLTGQQLAACSIDDYAKNVWLLKTDNLKTGVYLLQVQNQNGTQLYNQKLYIFK